jgi:dinuclear metal center YbgI/SA1388 family protein
MRLAELIAAMEEIAPTRHAESWDNVGLLAGDPEQTIRGALLTIDYTREVAEEAQRANCGAIIAYHPPIFEPLKRIIAGSLIFDALRRGVAVYSPHTALDVANGGTNDMLADAVGMAERAPLRLAETKARNYKLVTFVPENDLERVSRALFDAGAGRIGNYTSCSFRSPGTGTFFGDEKTNPAVGRAGQLEQAQEIRIETIVPIEQIDRVIRALREAHPYEEPAFDLNQLAAPPEVLGQGRVGTLKSPTPRQQVFDQIKRELGVEHLLIAGPTAGNVTRAAVCAGACGDLLNDALRERVDLYLTGEMRHHDALRAAALGVTVVCTLHSNSERAVLRRVQSQLQQRLPALSVQISQVDRDPFEIR